ncbi:N-acetylmuramoyl-L-alanine amidase [Aerococcus sp. 150760007-1]|uniref:LysM peptidoglycan-binding domain-containing protein n=1 Tax=Aerococcus urinaeequi TaxID=51665 RepID=A0ABR5ZZW2_9LACT|nr:MULTISPECIES: LysM peptidoglycan-binding domain-containing protein [Lactobacillales]KAF3304098.1 LysM peptidoglycan-binding domain-containing protein [Carnobacterium sp. PL17GRE32]MBA5747278.1 LysM peptidoglycan-binding domain-containing protein [Aerococcus urinaeequi]MBA5830062.1 LysM peptidoglycan-binding domain-containing protein [Aerococcus urinaeequi]MBA5860965.1 LysM peptidoglycan-binding domain-containing protein [Aerococcus urinaeequi]
MKLNKIILGTSFALAGLFAATNNNNVEAATWSARTVAEVSADLEATDDTTTSYTIQYGDTLATIAKASDVSVDALVAINDIQNANVIFPGTKLSFTKDETTGEVNEVTVEDSVSEEATTYYVAEEEVTETTYEAPVEETTYEAPAEETTTVSTTSYSSSSAKDIIMQRESGGNPTATNGQYYGLFQLGDHLISDGASVAEQHRVADNYVAERYGSWDAALAFWNANGFY